MKQAVAEQWITALRSDEYTQCTGQLKDGGGYCCLGVLTDLYVKAGEPGQWEDHNFIYTDEPGYQRTEAFAVPYPVVAWAGLKETKYATALNDDERWSFSKIADWIESNWETM